MTFDTIFMLKFSLFSVVNYILLGSHGKSRADARRSVV